MVVLLLIGFIVYLLFKVDSLRQKLIRANNRLKENSINYCPNCGYKLTNRTNNDYEISKENKESIDVYVDNDEAIVMPKIKKDYNEIKNNSILITGSILIILAAIIFLTTSWNITSNWLKCIIIFILFLVFLLFSKLATKKYDLVQTGRAFKYIAFAYLPLSLISLSIFKLIGENFSINGVYQNLYFAISLFLSSGIYYAENTREKDKLISISAIITTILGIIFLIKTFTNSVIIILIGLYIYSYILALLYEKQRYIYSEKLLSITNTIIFWCLTQLSVFTLIVSLFLGDITIYNFILILMAISLTIYHKKYYNIISMIINYILISLIFISLSVIIGDVYIVKQLIVLLSIPTMYLYNLLIYKKFSGYSFIYSSLIIGGIFLSSIINQESFSISFISLFYLILNLITYILVNNNLLRRLLNYFIPFVIEITTLLYIIDYKLNFVLLIIISTILVALPLIKYFSDYRKELILFPSIVNFITVICLLPDKSFIVMFLVTLLVGIYYLLFMKYENFYKYILFIFINIGLIYLGNIFANNLYAYMISLATIIIIFLDIINDKISDDRNYLVLIICVIISSLLLFQLYTLIGFIINMIISFVLVGYFIYKKFNIKYLYIPLFIPAMYSLFSTVLVYNDVNYMNVLNLILSGVVCLLVIKDNKYFELKVIPYAYIFITYLHSNIVYVPLFAALMTSIIYLIYSNKKVLFKVLIMLFILLIYYNVLNDLSIDYVFARTSILIIYTIYIFRYLIKDNKNQKIYEYLSFVFINLISLLSYLNQTDATVFVSFLTIFIIIGYNKKYGPLFITSLIFVVVNVFILTRLFWFSLPWWLYILVLGILLIIFAVSNELNEKNNLKNKIIDLKNKLDL